MATETATTMEARNTQRWRIAAIIGISIQFLALMRNLGEVYRVRWMAGPWVQVDPVLPYVTGAIIAAALCWVSVLLYAAGRYVLSVIGAVATVAALVFYKLVFGV